MSPGPVTLPWKALFQDSECISGWIELFSLWYQPHLTSLSRFFHTVRYLRGQQIVGQFRHRILSRIETPRHLLSAAIPSFPGCEWKPRFDFLPPGEQRNSAADVLSGHLTFLNHRQQVGYSYTHSRSEWLPEWSPTALPKLWQYNLHYFEWLWALEYEDARAVALDWIAKHQLSRGNVGWEPYPTSLRLMNCCGFFFGRYRERVLSDSDFLNHLWASLWRQSEYLSRHLEFHLLGNHLLENAAALCIVGSCFAGADAKRWLEKGLGILKEQTREQILPDGMHFELSPMYHSRICYLFLTLLNTGNQALEAVVRPVLGKMLNALRCLTHPDGEIALLNDSAFGIYNPPSELLKYAQCLGVALETAPLGAWALPDAGYYGFRSDTGDYIVCDAGRIGPDYIPGHAHADVFSFELSLNGQRVIVDSGVHDYERSEERAYCRSTRAHNTVEIEGQDQAEMWAAFKVGRRPRVKDINRDPRVGGFKLSAWHDGYGNLAGHPRVYRKFLWENRCFSILDQISSTKPRSAVGHLHLHSSCTVELVDSKCAAVNFVHGKFLISLTGNSEFSIMESFYCPLFGRKQRNVCITYAVPSDGSACRVDLKF